MEVVVAEEALHANMDITVIQSQQTEGDRVFLPSEMEEFFFLVVITWQCQVKLSKILKPLLFYKTLGRVQQSLQDGSVLRSKALKAERMWVKSSNVAET